MSAFLLFVYRDEKAAGRVLDEVRADTRWGGDFDSSAVVRVAADGKFTVTTTDWPGQGSPFLGMLWEALFGLVFLVPAAGSAYGDHLGGLFGAIDRAGIDEDVRARIRSALAPRTSGLGILLREPDAELIANVLHIHGGTVVLASLSLDMNSELAQELGGLTA